ncbi:MAG: hypothetical protein HC819_14990 [Cyclobacteriaceae bacterium]|nr:hypothetical protein [Cyclobacteriaceae bacterium]
MDKRQTSRIRKYPDNLKLKDPVIESGRTIKHIASKIGVSREALSNTLNGHYKGSIIIPKLKRELGINDQDNE